jgi:hypothetical protein
LIEAHDENDYLHAHYLYYGYDTSSQQWIRYDDSQEPTILSQFHNNHSAVSIVLSMLSKYKKLLKICPIFILLSMTGSCGGGGIKILRRISLILLTT